MLEHAVCSAVTLFTIRVLEALRSALRPGSSKKIFWLGLEKGLATSIHLHGTSEDVKQVFLFSLVTGLRLFVERDVLGTGS